MGKITVQEAINEIKDGIDYYLQDKDVYDTDPYKASVTRVYKIWEQFFETSGHESGYDFRETYWDKTREVFEKQKTVVYFD